MARQKKERQEKEVAVETRDEKIVREANEEACSKAISKLINKKKQFDNSKNVKR